MHHETVMIYTLSTCSHCKSTKKLLSENNVRFDAVDVDLLDGDEQTAVMEKVKEFNPRCSFPTIVIGNTIIVGFKEAEIRKALGL